MRYFNTEGICRPNEHYMVRLEDRLEKIKTLYVDRKKYFIINRGRQYGKTTTLRALAEYLKDDYVVVSLDFQAIGAEEFVDAELFVGAFAKMFLAAFTKWYGGKTEVCNPLTAFIEHGTKKSLRELFLRLSEVCAAADKAVVLMIDEVDSASNNQVFLDFLAQLRMHYLNREEVPTFHSVILAGVYDIKNLKLKIRPDEEHQYNSPWNIAAYFDIDMDFSTEQIADMLYEYEADHKTGMDVVTVAGSICQYTSGYPYLVSLICKILDETLTKNCLAGRSVWSAEGIAEAVKIILKSNVALFDSMARQLDRYQDLRKMIEDILYQGKRIPFSPDIKSVSMGLMFGFLKEKEEQVVVANRIFEMRLLNMFIAEEAVSSDMFSLGENSKNQFVKDNRLDMERVLRKFVEHFTDIYGDNDEKFVETYGRKFFLLYLKPIINGTGNYYIEAQTRDSKRTDVVVDYLGEQFVVELKIWHGDEYNERGEKQLADYLDYFHLNQGYLLSFNFNKKKETGVKKLRVGSKVIVEAVV